MNKVGMNCSLNDTKELKKLILENPDLPLLIFAGENANTGEYCYESTEASVRGIEKLTLYNDVWQDEGDFREALQENLCDEEKYAELTDKEFEAAIEEIVKETEFVEAIVIYVG